MAVTAVPVAVTPLSKVTVAPLSAVPVKVAVVSLVIPSVVEMPVSLAAVSAGVEGATGAVVSMVMVTLPDTGPRLPATSVAVAFSVWVPAPRVLEVTE